MAYWQRLGELVYKNGVHMRNPTVLLKTPLGHQDKTVSSWQGLAERRWRPRTQLPIPMPKRRWNLHHLHQSACEGEGVSDDGSSVSSRPRPRPRDFLAAFFEVFFGMTVMLILQPWYCDGDVYSAVMIGYDCTTSDRRRYAAARYA